jgi:hypothetical protein
MNSIILDIFTHMYDLDWGVVTPEASNINENEYTYVFNHKLSTPAEVDRTIRFVVGRLRFYDKHLPNNPRHLVKIDARGQEIDQNTAELIAQTIRKMHNRSNLREVNVIQK